MEPINKVRLEAANRAIESEAILHRRKGVYRDGKGPDALWGLALSGGGIRSATFCLGVLQALAKAKFNTPLQDTSTDRLNDASAEAAIAPLPLLARFDYLSTVSGGGYVGGFLSSLFRVRDGLTSSSSQAAAAVAAYTTLATDPPGRLGEGESTADRPLRWLRENGRYLAPSSTGDLFYDIAIGLRNLCAVHYVIGITLLTTFFCMFVFRYLSVLASDRLKFELPHWLEKLTQPASHGQIWFSPWFGIVFVWIAIAVIPCAIAYWLDQDAPQSKNSSQPQKTKRWQLPAPFLSAIVLFILGMLGIWCMVHQSSGEIDSIQFWQTHIFFSLMAAFEILLILALAVFSVAKFVPHERPVKTFRAHITRWLSNCLTVTSILGFLALVETLGQTLYLWLVTSSSGSATVSGVVAGVVALVAVARKFAPALAQPGKNGLIERLPLNAVFGVVGVMLAMLLAIAWQCVATALLCGLLQPPVGNGQLLVQWMFLVAGTENLGWTAKVFYHATWLAFCVGAVAVAGYFLGFIILSSLQVMYSARLTRAYLGASNGGRFNGSTSGLRVTEPHPEDDFKREAYYKNNHLGPAHIINVCINATTGSGDQLTQRDRHGIPMAITPAGILVNGEPLEAAKNPFQELSIGQWIGISGAAFSTGLGRGTSLGLAILFTVINIRLGWWWDSGKPDKNPALSLLRNQTYLQREMRASFSGTDSSHWYLSDGGHFENTGVFELLRRRVDFVVCCDCGADPQYIFEDMANLMRLARIEFGAEFAIIPASSAPPFTQIGNSLQPYLATTESELRSGGGEGVSVQDEKCALLYRVTYATTLEGRPQETFLLVFKPRLVKGLPLDLVQYKSSNNSFPQQSTFDQFFDEAQWESYRKLGILLGSKIFH